MRQTLSLLIFLTFWVASASAGQLYKWVDAEGNVQFSNLPPPENVEAEVSDLPAAPPAEEAAAEETNEADTGEDELSKGITPEELQNRNCQTARRDYDLLKGDQQLMSKGKDGKMYPLKPKERAAKLKQAEQNVEQFCNQAESEEDSPEKTE